MADLDVIEPIPRLDPIVAIGKDELVEGGLEGAANRPIIALANQVAYVMERTYSKTDVDDLAADLQEMIAAAEKGLLFFETQAQLLASSQGEENRAAQARDTGKIYLWKIKSAVGVTPVVWGWVDTGESDLEKARLYAEALTNINIYRGISQHPTQYNALNFDKTALKLNYAPNEITYKGFNVNGGFIVPFNGELRSKLQVWVKVKNAVLNGGTMRFLVQAVKNDNSTFMSIYGNIANAAVGWVKLGEAAISEANRAAFKHVNIQPHVINGAELTVEDFYIGEGTPLNTFIRAQEPKDRIIARTAERKSILPHWSKMPVMDGVTYNENGDITIQPGKYFQIRDVAINDVNRLYYSCYMDQVVAGDCRLYFRGFRKGLTTFHDVPYFPGSVLGNEFSEGVWFDSVINKFQIDIHNYSTTDAITLRSFDVCYDPIAPNGKTKIGDRFDVAKIKSEIVQTVAGNKPYQNFSTMPNFEKIPKSADGKRYAVNGAAFSEAMNLGHIKPNTRYYLSLPDSISNLGENGGKATLVFYHQRASDNASLGGVSLDFVANGGALNASLTTAAETGSLNFRIDLTNGATVKLGRVILSEVPYSTETVFQDYFLEDKTGQIVSNWEYPKLTGYERQGLAVDYPLTEEEGDLVLAIPNTAATGNGQGVRWIVNMPEGATQAELITFMAKAQYTGATPAKVWVRYYREGSTVEMGAILFDLSLNRDGTWTLCSLLVPPVYGGYQVKYIQFFLFNGPNATAPLYLKRFIQTKGVHNPFIKFIKNANEKAATGLSDFLRLKDALAEQPQTVFSVGRQLFRPLKEVQQTIEDYELINGNSLLPTRLNNLRYIDSNGYLIAFIDRDDTVYLRKGLALYKTTVDDLNSRCEASSVSGNEKRGVFNSNGLTLINANAPSGFLRVTGDNTFVMVSQTAAHYSLDGGVNWVAASGYQDTKGEHYNAWGTDCSDNIVLTSGYKIASQGRGTGRVNFSDDNGKTYKVILDLETSDFIDNARRGSMHIHSVKYDPYWHGVWVIMGDGAFENPNSSVVSNLWFIENPGTEQQTMISYDCRGQDWLNEQHVSVFPMQDCILFGADANPTALYRMARTKNTKALRDTVAFISTALSHYGCGGYQHKSYLPVSIYFGKASEYTGPLNDKVYLTYDGVNVVEIYTEPETSNTPGGKVNTFAFALDKYFIFERRTDQRFLGGNTWIMADIRYFR